MKNTLLMFAAGVIITMTSSYGQAPEVVISSQIQTNSIVGVAKRIVVDMEASEPSVSVIYASRQMVGTNAVSETPWAPITIGWAALTNRYPEVLQILSRMREDMAARMTNTP